MHFIYDRVCTVYAAALWPSIAMVVKKEQCATAYGVVTAVQVCVRVRVCLPLSAVRVWRVPSRCGACCWRAELRACGVPADRGNAAGVRHARASCGPHGCAVCNVCVCSRRRAKTTTCAWRCCLSVSEVRRPAAPPPPPRALAPRGRAAPAGRRTEPRERVRACSGWCRGRHPAQHRRLAVRARARAPTCCCWCCCCVSGSPRVSASPAGAHRNGSILNQSEKARRLGAASLAGGDKDREGLLASLVVKQGD
jgi:hypothetical protein